MKIQIPKAYEVLIIIDEDKGTVAIDIDEGTHSVEIDRVHVVKVNYVEQI